MIYFQQVTPPPQNRHLSKKKQIVHGAQIFSLCMLNATLGLLLLLLLEVTLTLVTTLLLLHTSKFIDVFFSLSSQQNQYFYKVQKCTR